MEYYRDYFNGKPYIQKEGYKNCFIWRLMTPNNKPSNSLTASRSGYLHWYLTNKDLTEEELNQEFEDYHIKTKRGYKWAGPFIY